MRFITMGPKERTAECRTILFIPGLSAKAESCWGEVGRLLQRDWRIVICELDGHYDGSPAFPGVDGECLRIETYIRENHGGHIHGVVGLSLGGTIAVSLLGRGRVRIDRAVLDAAFCVDMGVFRGLYAWLFPKCVIRVRDGRYMPGFLIDMFMGRGNRSLVEMIYAGISEETCRSACREVYSYRIPDDLGKTDARVEFWRGAREPYPKKGAMLLRSQLPGMTERVFPEMGHCQFLHEHPEAYAALLDEYMKADYAPGSGESQRSSS